MEMEQKREWAEAQKITVSVNLVKAAKRQLEFLAAVDKNRFLYEDHVLQRAVYRYNAFWLPLLAKHLEKPVSDGPLVVPLDCEWIWHCHRLNPVRYLKDCKQLFGRMIGNYKVISSVHALSKTSTEEIWTKMYPEEPYELDLSIPFSEDVLTKESYTEKSTDYDLIAAVKRQMPFTYQVSRPHMSDDRFLLEAAARYKGFLYITKANSETKDGRYSVPTYDVDLMWHTHQLYPDLYCKDTFKLVGSVIQHDDTDSDRSKGGKLRNGFSETTQQWEDTYGFGYWKAGAMYNGSVPTPITQVPFKSNVEEEEFMAVDKFSHQIEYPALNSVEVLLDFVDFKNLPEEYKENLVIKFSKKQPDTLFSFKGSNGTVPFHSGEKEAAWFHCQPTGDFLLELVSNEQDPKSCKRIGSCSISFDELLANRGPRFSNKWVAVDLESELGISEPVLLKVSVSFTPSTPAPQEFKLVQSETLKNDKSKTVVLDRNGNKIMSLHNRDSLKDATKCGHDFGKEVYSITDSGKEENLVEFRGNHLSVKGTHGSFKLQQSSGNDESVLELVGHTTVKLFLGRRLEFENMQFENQESRGAFMTAVEFSTDYPYGKAVALIDLISETIKVTKESMAIPCIGLAFTLSNIVKAEGQRCNCTLKDKSNNVKIDALSGTPCNAACGHQGGCLANLSLEAKTDAFSGTPCNASCGHQGGCLANLSLSRKTDALSGTPCNAACGHQGGCLANLSLEVKTDAVNGTPCNAACGHQGGCLANLSLEAKSDALSGTPCNAACGHQGGCLANLSPAAKTDGLNGIPCHAPCGHSCLANLSLVAKTAVLSGTPCNAACGHQGGCLANLSLEAKTDALTGTPCNAACGHQGGCLANLSLAAKTDALNGTPCNAACGHQGGCLANLSLAKKTDALSGTPCNAACGHQGGCLANLSLVAKTDALSGTPCNAACGHQGGCLANLSQFAKTDALSGTPCNAACGHQGGCLANLSLAMKIDALNGTPCNAACGHQGGCLANLSLEVENDVLSGTPCNAACGHQGGCLANLSLTTKIAALSGTPCNAACGHQGGCLANLSLAAKPDALNGTPCNAACGHQGGCLANLSLAVKSDALNGTPCNAACGHQGGCLANLSPIVV